MENSRSLHWIINSPLLTDYIRGQRRMDMANWSQEVHPERGSVGGSQMVINSNFCRIPIPSNSGNNSTRKPCSWTQSLIIIYGMVSRDHHPESLTGGLCNRIVGHTGNNGRNCNWDWEWNQVQIRNLCHSQVLSCWPRVVFAWRLGAAETFDQS